MTTDAVYVLVDGDSQKDDQIRDLYNSGWEPTEIGAEMSIRYEKVVDRLKSLEHYGEIKRRENGGWTIGICNLSVAQRSCGVQRPNKVAKSCQHCRHRRVPRGGPR